MKVKKLTGINENMNCSIGGWWKIRSIDQAGLPHLYQSGIQPVVLNSTKLGIHLAIMYIENQYVYRFIHVSQTHTK